jgi:hypothetical protein
MPTPTKTSRSEAWSFAGRKECGLAVCPCAVPLSRGAAGLDGAVLTLTRAKPRVSMVGTRSGFANAEVVTAAIGEVVARLVSSDSPARCDSRKRR